MDFANPTLLPLSDIERQIRLALIDAEFFDAKLWGLPELNNSEWNEELDHSWHEFESVEEINNSGNQLPSIESLLRIIQTRREHDSNI
jgi:hypothetical protein